MPKQPLCAFTGDNHLRPVTWIKHPTLFGDAYESWRQIITACEERRLPLVLLGDLFDSTRPDSHSVGVYLHGMMRMERAGLAVYYIEGNHDVADPPWASLTPWARPVGQFTLGGIKAYGLSFVNSTQLPEELARIPAGTQLLLSHQSWLEIQRVGHTDGQFGMIPHGLTMIVADYHVCGIYRGKAGNGEDVVAYSPGSTAMQALNEPPDKYFGILYDDMSVEWVQLETRPCALLTCNTPEELDDLVARIPGGLTTARPFSPDIQKPILRVRYNDMLPEAYSRLTAAAGEQYHLFLEPQRQVTTQVIDVEAVPQTAFQSLVTAIGELCTPDSPEHRAARRLLESNAPQQELEAIYREYLAANANTQQVSA